MSYVSVKFIGLFTVYWLLTMNDLIVSGEV